MASRVNTFAISFLISLVVGFQECAAQSSDDIDVTKFEIGTVRLYLNAQETIEALKKNFGVKAKEVESYEAILDKSGSNRKFDIRYSGVIVYWRIPTALDPGKTYIPMVRYEKEGGYVYMVGFSERLPDDAARGPEAVYRIRFCDSNKAPAETLDELFERNVIEKYGPPNSKSGGWCAFGSQKDKEYCPFSLRMYISGIGTLSSALGLENRCLYLEDNAYPQNASKAIQNIKDKRALESRRKPPF